MNDLVRLAVLGSVAAAAGTAISALATLLAVAGCARIIGSNLAKGPLRYPSP